MRIFLYSVIFVFCFVSVTLADGFISNPDHYLGFIENKGQVHDQSGNLRDDVKFVFAKNDFKLVLRNDGFSFEFTRSEPAGNSFPESGELSDDEYEDLNADKPFEYEVNRIDIVLKNCNTDASIYGESPLPNYLNYFNQHTGPAGITHVQSFSRVVYQNIYDHIDLVFFLERKNDRLIPHYEFVVNAGGKMKDIELACSGQDKLAIHRDGSLRFEMPLGWATSSRPQILSADRKFVATGSFVKNGSTISFARFKSEATESFIIDPEIHWGTYYGGIARDLTDEIACDHLGNVYLTGRTQSLDQIATDGAHQTYNAGYNDAPLIKFDADGNLVWATYYGGETNDVAFAVTVDPFNDAWIGGRTISTTGIATEDAIVDTFAGGYFDVFIAKFNPEGVLLFGTYLGDTLKDEVQSMNTNAEGDIYVSGYSESVSAMSTPGAWKEVGDWTGDNFLLKLNNDGQLIWGTYQGGEGRDRGHGVEVDGRGHVYQFGTTDSKHHMATDGAYQDTLAGLNDGFLSKWTEDDGYLIWCTYYGGEGDERARDMRIDRAGYIYAMGQTESETGIATPGVLKDSLVYLPTQDRDGFLVKFDSNGNRLWGTYYGGNNIDMPRSLQIATDGSVCYIGGYTRSDTFPTTPGAYNRRRGGGNDAFFLMINWNATALLYSTYYGGRNSESITEGGWYGPTLDRDDNGNIFLSSGTTSDDSIATPNGYKTTLNDTTQYDFFVVKFLNPCMDGFEPQNDSMDTAPPLLYNLQKHGYSYQATIYDNKDKDYFSFTKPLNYDNIKVTLNNLPFDCNLFVYDENQNLLAKSQNSGTTNESVFIPETYFSKYYVMVKSPTHEYSTFNCYSLKILESVVAKMSLTCASWENVTLYPNPAQNLATLSMENAESENLHLQLCNSLGQVVWERVMDVTAGENEIPIPLDHLSSGSYFVQMLGASGTETLKLQVTQ